LQVIEIDGSIGEGGGQILRTSMSLATIFKKPIRITNIRANRRDPGLKPQHLQSVIVASRLCGGTVNGAEIGSTSIEFLPGELNAKHHGVIDTGTAGSISLIAQTIIPISIFGSIVLDVEIRGGTEVPNSPTIDYLNRLVLPIYEKLGAGVNLNIRRRGYYPKGGGVVDLKSSRNKEPSPLELDTSVPDKVPPNIMSVSRQLPEHVARRQAESTAKILSLSGNGDSHIEIDSSGDSLSPGSSVTIYKKSSTTFIGSSSLGERGKKAESVGDEAALDFLKEVKSNPNVDSHLADMLVTLLSCVKGKSRFRTSILTAHFITNCEVAKKMTGCEIQVKKSGLSWVVEIDGSPEKPN